MNNIEFLMANKNDKEMLQYLWSAKLVTSRAEPTILRLVAHFACLRVGDRHAMCATSSAARAPSRLVANPVISLLHTVTHRIADLYSALNDFRVGSGIPGHSSIFRYNT